MARDAFNSVSPPPATALNKRGKFIKTEEDHAVGYALVSTGERIPARGGKLLGRPSSEIYKGMADEVSKPKARASEDVSNSEERRNNRTSKLQL